MKEKWIEVKNVIVGVVYRYYTADGKSYIGCTINERKRMYAWNWKNNSYGGIKIAAARKFLGLGAFKYERLFVIITDSEDGLIRHLEALEAKYIEKFDSYNNGYNTNKGGRGNLGVKMSESWKAKIKNSSTKKAVRLIPNDGSEEKVFESLMETSRQLKISVGRVHYYLNKATNKSVKGYKLKLIA